MTAWLTILGVDEEGGALSDEAQGYLKTADIVFGSKRLLSRFVIDKERARPWPSPFSEAIESIKMLHNTGVKVAILATGDPMHFGIGATLSKILDPCSIRILPAPSAFSLAAARLKWPLQDVLQTSFHGRPVERIAAFVQPNRRIIALTENSETIHLLSQHLIDLGYGKSRLTILEAMGTECEKVTTFACDNIAEAIFDDFNTVAIECIADDRALLRQAMPGLKDAAFIHDGQLTKQDIRVLTLMALRPCDNDVLWDIGAGCGSIAIEWMRSALNHAVAFECNAKRLRMIRENADKLGAPELEIIAGRVTSETIEQRLDQPNAIFLGGSLSDEALFLTVFSRLKRGGRCVVNAVTLEGEEALLRRHLQFGGSLLRIDIAKSDQIGEKHGMRSARSILQWRYIMRPFKNDCIFK